MNYELLGLRWCKLLVNLSLILFLNQSQTQTVTLRLVLQCVSLTLVVIHAHGSVSLVVCHVGAVGAVNGKLEVIRSEPMPMCVWIGEKTPLW